MEDHEKRQAAAVYVAWGTFKNAIERLSEAIPNRIDKTVYPGLNPAVVSQLLTAFRFLGLIEESGRPTAILQSIATKDESVRKQRLEAVIRQRYSDLFNIDLEKTTPAELAELMERSYGVTGSTRDRAIRFFLASLGYVGVRVSQLLKVTPNGGGVRKRRAPRPRAVQPSVESVERPDRSDGGSSRVISLASGGTLTLLASLNYLALSPSDRKFFGDLIDRLDEYERGPEQK